jgi:putative DNA primase/helicase
MAPRRSNTKDPDDNDRWRSGELPPGADEDCDPMEVPAGPVREVIDALDMYADSDRPKPTLLNVVKVLELDPRWKGRVRYNQFSHQTELTRCPVSPGQTRPQSDEIDGETGLWLDDHYGLIVPTPRVAEAIGIVARRHSHHPVRDYLTSLVWDGEPRLSQLFSRYFGAEDGHLVTQIGRCFLISCVARIERPGCKVDTTPILVGAQGAYKSTGLRLLVPRSAWYADTHLDLGSKDLFENIQGIWLYELAELDSFKGREWSRIKSTLSSARDTWRRPYGRHSQQVDRQVVFCATTNEDEILGDPTGSRRFWPVRTGQIDRKALLADRDQLWAEAVAAFRKGERWWLGKADADELAVASEDFQVLDPWHDAVAEYVRNRPQVTVAAILAEGVKKPRENWTQNDQSRVVGILKRMSWTQHRPRSTEGKGRVWQPPKPEDEPGEGSS